MGSTPNVITESINAGETLNTFLARAVSDGTWADVLTKVKQQRGVPTVKEIENGAVSSFEIDLLHDLIRDYVSRAGGLALTYADVQTLQALGTNDGIVAGVTLARVVSGSWYKCITAGASTSTWEPVSGVWNVLDFGAVGNGSTDDATAVQAAIDACEAAGGGLVYFPASSYRVNTKLTVDSNNVTLCGDGHGCSVILGGASGLGTAVLHLSNADRCCIRDLRVNNRDRDVASGVGILVDGGSAQCTIRDCSVANAETGLKISGNTYYHRVQNVDANIVDVGFHVTDGANEQSFLFCRVNTTEHGWLFDDGAANGGHNNHTLFHCEVEVFTGDAVKCDTNNGGTISGISIFKPRWENVSAGSSVGLRMTASNVRGIRVMDPYLVQVNTSYLDAGNESHLFWDDPRSQFLRIGDLRLKYAGGELVLRDGDDTIDRGLECGNAEINGALDHDGANVGFYGTAPATKQTVTGSRGGNAALASLLTALASIGLITDSSSA